MKKIEGIRSVDFQITAKGHGVINWNGPTALTGDDGKEIENHSLPKLRGFSNLSGRVKEGTGYKYKKTPSEINFKDTPLYVSQNCIRHHLFRDQAFDLHLAGEKNLQKVLASFTGLIRGYVVPASQCKRTSPLLLEDFVDNLGNGNFEQMGRSGSKEKQETKKGAKKSSTHFSKTTFGDTRYSAYGSISIEQLQFISLDNKFDRAAMIIKDKQGEEVAKAVEKYIQSLDPNCDPKAVFHPNYVRKGTIFEEGEAGIMLDNTAVDVMIRYTLECLSELAIRQAKGYLYVEDIQVDYNDSKKMMRIKSEPSEISEEAESEYAVYFYPKEV